MSILRMSFLSAVLILVIAIARALLLHKLPKRTFLALWGVALCRALIPFAVSSRCSIYSLLGMLKSRFGGVGLPLAGLPAAPDHPAIAGGILTLPETLYAGISPASAVWLIGLTGCFLFFLLTHLRCRREYRTALPVDNAIVERWQREHPMWRRVAVRQSDRISAPLTYGIFRPVVLLPKQMNWTDEVRLRYILVHEFVHIRRLDALTKLAMAVALSLHWFNPFVWLMYVLANRDVELSCDEAVIRAFGGKEQSAYALTLIGLEETKGRFMPLVSNFGRNAMEERIVSIMKTKKTSPLGAILALVLVLGTAVVFATGAFADDPKEGVYLVGTMNGTDTIYTDDGGSTWMSEAEYRAKNPELTGELEFWEIGEFENWMEQERVAYQELVDDGQGFYDTQTDRWRTWTQQDVDQLYQLWQMQLERMKQGYRFAKPIELPDGGALVGSFEPEDGAARSAGSAVISLGDGTVVKLEDFDGANGAEDAVKAYLDEQVKAGTMTRQEADDILKRRAAEQSPRMGR